MFYSACGEMHVEMKMLGTAGHIVVTRYIHTLENESLAFC